MKIKKATTDDFESIRKLELEWEKEGVCWGVKHSTRKELARHIKKDFVYVAEDKGEIVGYAIGKIVKTKETLDWAGIEKGQNYGLLEELYVAKKYRKKGVGALLVRNLIDEFKKHRLKVIKLKAVSKNLKELIRFYEKFGFKEKMADMVMKLK